MSAQALAVQPEHTLRGVYRSLTPEQKTWRCEAVYQAYNLFVKSQELLAPCLKGRWDKENAYNGLALFIKAIFTAQGWFEAPPECLKEGAAVVQMLQDHMTPVKVGGVTKYADDSPARYTLRVVYTALVTFNSAMFPSKTNEEGAVRDELLVEASRMARHAVDKLGGPNKHEDTMDPQERQQFAMMAMAGDNPSINLSELLQSIPTHISAIFLLQGLYDIDMRTIKWVLCWIIARCAKEAYGKVLNAAAAHGAPAVREAARAYQEAAKTMAGLRPGSSLGAFMCAEALGHVQGSNMEALREMQQAAKLAERKGDDLLAWIAHLNVAQLLVYGAGGPTFSVMAVDEALQQAAANRSSVMVWKGGMLMEGRARALKATIKEAMEQARQKAQEAAGPQGVDPESDRLPCVQAPFEEASEPLPRGARSCSQCGYMFHKTMACGQCKGAWYCGRDCQLAHWKAGHKSDCKRLKAEREARGPDAGEDDE